MTPDRAALAEQMLDEAVLDAVYAWGESPERRPARLRDLRKHLAAAGWAIVPLREDEVPPHARTSDGRDKATSAFEAARPRVCPDCEEPIVDVAHWHEDATTLTRLRARLPEEERARGDHNPSGNWDGSDDSGPAATVDPLSVQEADMCPNCVTPWKCNGPHLKALPSLDRNLLAQALERLLQTDGILIQQMHLLPAKDGSRAYVQPGTYDDLAAAVAAEYERLGRGEGA